MTPKTILIADDDRDLVSILAARCRKLGLEVISAYDAMSALTLAHSRRPDVVCLDVNMPGGDGLGVGEMLQGDDELQSTPIIMLTGRTDEQTVRRCHSLYAYYVLKAPDVWNRIEPLLCEILDITLPDPAPAETYDRTSRDHGGASTPRGQLRRLVDIISREAVHAQDADASENPGAGSLPDAPFQPREAICSRPTPCSEPQQRGSIQFVSDGVMSPVPCSMCWRW